MNIFWKKNKLSAIILLFVIFLAAAVYLITLPLVGQIKRAAYDLQAQMIDREFEKSRLGILPRLEEDMEEYEAKKSALAVVLSPEKQLDFIKGVEAMAEKTGNEVKLKMDPSGGAKELTRQTRSKETEEEGKKEGIMADISYPSYFPIKMSLEGDYAGLVNFIHLLENDQYYVNIISLDMKKGLMEEKEELNAIFSDTRETDKTRPQAEKSEVLISEISAIVYIKNHEIPNQTKK